MKQLLLTLNFLAAVFLFSACGPEPQQVHFKPFKKDTLKEPLIQVNKRQVNDEALQIDNYVKRHGLNATITPTGLRYVIYQKNKNNGALAKSGEMVLVHFTCYLLNGTEVYTSRKGGPVEILIDRDNVEDGVHEGLKYMHLGDKAKFILPSHLAHGLVGDENKIPPLTPIVYDIELIRINKTTK